MALETAFQQLAEDLERLCDALIGLHMTLTEDRPEGEGVLLFEQFGDASTAMLGDMREARDATARAQLALDQTADLHRARRELAICQERVGGVAREYSLNLTTDEQMSDLTAVGNELGTAWAAWVESVKESLRRCRRPLYDINLSLFQCWREVASHAATTSVSVNNTNVGQRVEVRDADSELVEREGVT